MGLFKRRNKKQETENLKTVLPKAYYEEDAELRKQFVESYCKQMAEISGQLEEAKREYEAVTEALTDIQLLDEAEPEQMLAVVQAATKVLDLNSAREEVKQEQNKISQTDYFHMMDIEKDYPKLLKRMEEDENYCQAVRSDMHYLEGEKGSLKFELSEHNEKRESLGKLSRGLVTALAIAIAMLIFAVVGFALDITVAGSIVFLAAAIVGVSILCMYQNHTYKAKLIEQKLNKAISLLNSTKIKYVNITNSLDHQYIKHNVNNAYEFSRLFEIYREAKEERIKFQKTAGELRKAEQDLLEILYNMNLRNPQIWIYKAIAFVDKREMVEVRHEFNTNRQKLREQMDYNSKAMNECKDQIMEFARINSRHADEIMQIVDTFRGL
ncbi:MAG: hypothetical protein J6B39_02980 [Lachnospiraceae bacterium]|nr:hypothetical protein [Lachnospiraceae bacterium]